MTHRQTVTWSTAEQVTIPADGNTYEVQIHNGLCYCRGSLNLHPFHRALPYLDVDEYIGKHRAP